MTTTDDERRRVAAALRRYVKTYACPTWRILCGIVLGGDNLNTVRMIQTLDRLADLIDPDTTTDTTKTGPDTTEALNSHPDLGTEEVPTSRVPECDREAVLSVAESMDSYAWLMVQLGVDTVPDVILGYVRRIREACGEVA